MSGQCCRQMIWAAMMLLVWAGLILLGGLIGLVVLHIGHAVAAGPDRDLYVGLAMLVGWRGLMFALRGSFRREP